MKRQVHEKYQGDENDQDLKEPGSIKGRRETKKGGAERKIRKDGSTAEKQGMEISNKGSRVEKDEIKGREGKHQRHREKSHQ